MRILFVVADDGPEKSRLVARYDHLRNVRFLPVQSAERLSELFNLADVHVLPQDCGVANLVLPSKLGGMLASGKDCIVMADPGAELYEFLKGSVTLLPPGDAQILADGILTTTRTHNGKKVHAKSYDLHTHSAARYLCQLKTILTASGKRR